MQDGAKKTVEDFWDLLLCKGIFLSTGSSSETVEDASASQARCTCHGRVTGVQEAYLSEEHK
ncbi:uncharacterized protein UDID_17173 [Ustilago sp. UG-2017a]|nr:uncharacterized protein UDID_17173 [Ustilago sp. UG-2017a]